MSASQGIRAGRAFVELFADDRRLVRGLKRASAKLKAWGAGLTSLGAKLLGVGSAIALPMSLAIKAASDMEETMNKFNVVFGANAKAVKAWGDEFGANVGRSKRQIADFMAGTQDLLVPIGLDPGAATNMSKQITGLAVDLASFNNKVDADVLRDLHAALTGSGEVMKKYGVLVSQAAVKQELLNQGIDAKNASEQQKVMARWSIILKGTTAAQGDAVRSAGSFANQMKALRANIEDAATAVGQALLPAVTPIVSKVAKLVRITSDWLGENKDLALIIAKVAVGVAAAGAVFVGLGSVLALAGMAMGGLVTIISTVGTVLGGIGSAILALVSPIGIVAAALIGLGGYFLYASGIGKQVLGWLSQKFTALADTAKKAWGGIADALAAGDIALAARILWLSLKVAWQAGLAWLSGLWVEFKGFWADGVMGLAMYFTDAVTKIKSAWVEAIGFLKKKWLEFSNSGFTESMADLIAPIVAVIEGVSVDDVRKNLNQDFAHKRKMQPGQVEDIDAQTRAKQQEIENDRQGTQDQLAEDTRRRKLRESSQAAQGRAELEQARREWQEALALAAKKRSAKEEADLTIEEPQLAATVGGLAGGDLGFDLSKLSSKGTFNAMAARGLSSNGPMEKVAQATEATAANTKKLVQKAQDMRFG